MLSTLTSPYEEGQRDGCAVLPDRPARLSVLGDFFPFDVFFFFFAAVYSLPINLRGAVTTFPREIWTAIPVFVFFGTVKAETHIRHNVNQFDRVIPKDLSPHFFLTS
jgi:hypothetical protein